MQTNLKKILTEEQSTFVEKYHLEKLLQLLMNDADIEIEDIGFEIVTICNDEILQVEIETDISNSRKAIEKEHYLERKLYEADKQKSHMILIQIN